MSQRAGSREDWGRPPCMLHPMGTILLIMRPLQLVNVRLEFCRATLIAGVTTSVILVVYP